VAVVIRAGTGKYNDLTYTRQIDDRSDCRPGPIPWPIVHPFVQRLVAAELISDISAVPIEDLRSLRAECAQVEGDISFVRRVVQGRLDMIGYEAARRVPQTGRRSSDGGQIDTTVNILFDLPDVLTTGGATPLASQRHMGAHEPGPVAISLASDVDAIIGSDEMAALASLSDERLSAIMESLRGCEMEMSGMRRQLHERIDAIQAEVVRRYQAGEASADFFLNQ